MPGQAAFYSSITQKRMLDLLQTSVGAAAWAALTDPAVNELSVNADGSIWVDRVGEGRVRLDETLPLDNVRSILMIVADAKGERIGDANPSFDALLPGLMYRFVGTLPPLTRAPSFTIRKKPSKVFSLAEYERAGILTGCQAAALTALVEQRRNILIAGGTGSGKTTLANAVLEVIARTGHRIVTIEDTPELQNSAADQEALFTVPGVRTAQDCLRIVLRMHPDRIVFGEVRGPEVRDLLMTWNTGHPGGLSTIHADSAHDSLHRIEEMLETIPNYQPKPSQIARVVHAIAYIAATRDLSRFPAGRHLAELVLVRGWDAATGYKLESLA